MLKLHQRIVYIIDEVHELSEKAFNALLLTLEEPPSHIVFIFATTNIESVPITILSRCQRYDFKKLSNEELSTHLRNIADKENISITDDAIEEITYLSDGGCRDALSILNQLSTSNESIDLEVVLNNYGSVSLVQIKNIVNAYVENEYNQIKTIFENLEKASVDYKVFLKKLIDQFFQKALECKEQKNNHLYLKIKDTIFELNDVINKININVDPFLLIFLILVKNVGVQEPNDDIDSVDVIDSKPLETKTVEKKDALTKSEKTPLKESKTVETVLETNDSTFENDTYLAELKKVRINNCFAQADKTLLKDSKEKWKQFNDQVSLVDTIKSIIIDMEVVLASSTINLITDAQESIVEMFNANLESIEEKYEEILLLLTEKFKRGERRKNYEYAKFNGSGSKNAKGCTKKESGT